MDDDSRLSLIIVLLLLCCAAFCAVCETALSSVSRNRIKMDADRGDNRAKAALFALDHFEQAITTLLILTNITHIAAASVVTVTVTRIWGLGAVSLSTIIMTIIVFFAGEMLPKTIGKKKNEECILACAGILKLLMKILAPLSGLLSAIGQAAARATSEEAEPTVTEDELYDLIEDLEEEGSIDEEQSDLFSSVLQFSDVTVDSIITHRVDMEAIDIEDDPEEIRREILETNHSRIPVYEGTPDNIIGILRIRKYLKAGLGKSGTEDIRPLLDPAYYAPQSMGIRELLELMSKNKMSIAVVTDSFGGTLGIVTVEDILEELVGEIWDEDDMIEEPMVKLGEDAFMISADETVDHALDFAGCETGDEEEAERFTNLLVGEWVYEMCGEIPSPGDSFVYDTLKVTVSEMEKNRILRVRFDLLPVSGEGGEA